MKNSCEVCKYYLQSICGGVGKICEDYYEVPKIMENEKSIGRKKVMHQDIERKVFFIQVEADFILNIYIEIKNVEKSRKICKANLLEFIEKNVVL